MVRANGRLKTSLLQLNYKCPSSGNRLPVSFNMCGRATQTLITAREAGLHLGASTDSIDYVEQQECNPDDRTSSGPDNHSLDNYNMCPGMKALIILKDGDRIVMDRMAWGLITRKGTDKTPLPTGKKRMSMHFQNLMFNARSDTLFSKPTFSKLCLQKRACVVALDGYFEWKQSALGSGKGKKQPYYVYRSKASTGEVAPLLIAGLWTQVSTSIPEEPALHTFTILTTEPCEQIKWLHNRMPLCLWDKKSCLDWLENPSPSVLKLIDSIAAKAGGFKWHMVSTEISNLKFQGEKAIQAIKPPPSVLSFFATAKPKAESVSANTSRGKARNEKKPDASLEIAEPSKQAFSSKQKERSRPSPVKQTSAKKRKITSFFEKQR